MKYEQDFYSRLTSSYNLLYNEQNKKSLNFNKFTLQESFEPAENFEIDKQDLEILKDPTRYIAQIMAQKNTTNPEQSDIDMANQKLLEVQEKIK